MSTVEHSGGVDPNVVIQKMAVKLANVELRNSILEVALESAQAEIARLNSPAPTSESK
jgi:hypothetical protein